MKYHFKVFKENAGYWAECLELQGCRTQASTKSELIVNMRDALNLFLSEPEVSNVIFPLPSSKIKSKKDIVVVPVPTKTAIAFYLRRYRLLHNFSQSQMSKKLNMNNLYTYQKLESPKTANPELLTLAKIKDAFPDFKVDEVLA